ncbi:unnamed protein product [Candidula unifasciata]|uniref:G-protein coupled receptors family 1 profile domain-containing protein n=1 Tax=Candidula unifasciata TaxID=100452 RepID=A0A8S3ZZ08_9EUPU|nr:unnamed protein product [Candidula unifasciata]
MDLNLTNPSYVLTYITDEKGVFNATFDIAEGLDQGSSDKNSLPRKITLGTFFAVAILIAIIGNLLVCTAVFTERRLKRIKNNYFIVSLAVADLLVSGVVMTFAMANDIEQQWMFGGVFCRIWISLDVMCSTASILNLCVISFDRFKHIQNAMYYDTWMTTSKALTFIGCVWFLSALISFLPIQLDWHQGAITINETITAEDQCIIKLNFIYAIISSTISFYAPCLVMLILYFRLFLFARKHAISIRSQKRPVTSSPGERTNNLSNGSNRTSLKASDHKAAFTLGVITGVFLCCWLPFFIINPINAYDPNIVHPNVFVVSTWLGYVNSCLNPIIYSIFNTEFREAFKRILFLRTCRRTSSLPSTSGTNSTRIKHKKSDYEQQPSDNGSILRKTSRDRLFNEKITRV